MHRVPADLLLLQQSHVHELFEDVLRFVRPGAEQGGRRADVDLGVRVQPEEPERGTLRAGHRQVGGPQCGLHPAVARTQFVQQP
ncbi:hypothetical protein OG730_27160 [Streptomyces sp. NBC_01298]|uniref:hypothetical protein n=1 Tax=Streptomyces sp. NBC_01298 TaxID=2903817 RepID=UPI002E13593D|nr:hypothetical protein OG730_27160 [Streptomyces sp. NBC_01298]